MGTNTKDALEVAQLVKEAADAKRVLGNRAAIKRLLDDGEPVDLADDDKLDELVGELFGAIDKLEAFYMASAMTAT